MSERPKAVVSWSTGKDSAYALWEALQVGEVEVIGVLTTISSEFGRVSMHGVREELLDRQVEELGLPCWKVSIPSPCSNDVYEREMGRVLHELEWQGVTHVVFGDLFLGDVRQYREARLKQIGLVGLFPLWMRNTAELARQMQSAGIEAVVTCVDSRRLHESFSGRSWDARFLSDLPEEVDPCGENGEFHTCVTRGPMLRSSINVQVGEIVKREGFVFADVIPTS